MKSKLSKAIANYKNQTKKRPKQIKESVAEQKKPVSTAARRPFLPFTKNDYILLVGEGDYSFAKALIARKLARPATLVATGLDSKQDLKDKYGQQALDNIKYLEDAGVTVITEVSITVPFLKRSKLKDFDLVIFNFPHIGNSISDVDRNIRQHQLLLQSYFAFAKKVIKQSGGVAVTMFEGEPYDSWNVRGFAHKAELKGRASGAFPWHEYEGYSHKRTAGLGKTNKEQSNRKARMYVFQLKSYEEQPIPKGLKRKRDDEDDYEDDYEDDNADDNEDDNDNDEAEYGNDEDDND
ncbi:hypothetical protein CANCADRAFT_84572 [Tortispora caseinolytica NRRL Y-17796]|uniref:25S rRNA (uridine-N(3))-methyltransferase BMT5-like domain-containing protein n=1 Tax=Tortispora caseinolytica NRRL Y-17796 TaxID=767744 RepID=A0A1E4TKM8_9ASCO|nr:hypothetical protein CANCADRAFT_84572 [Tortispora caseinolytica NRRL Y-17796]